MADTPTPAETQASKRILFFADPMCSWCWGFSPVIRAISESFGDQAPIRLVVGGLRAGETRAMDDKSKAYVRHHWEQVQESTGQPFSYDFFDRDGFVYDTEPACRAAVTVRSAKPEATLDYFEAVQRAFYVDGTDTTDADALAQCAESVGVEPDVFTTLFQTPEIVSATRADFSLSHSLGVPGFPTVVVANGQELALLTSGYVPFEALKPPLEAWLAS